MLGVNTKPVGLSSPSSVSEHKDSGEEKSPLASPQGSPRRQESLPSPTLEAIDTLFEENIATAQAAYADMAEAISGIEQRVNNGDNERAAIKDNPELLTESFKRIGCL